MTNSEIAKIFFEQAITLGRPFKREGKASWLTFASSQNYDIPTIKMIQWGMSFQVSRRWAGLNVDFGLWLFKVPIDCHKGLIEADLRMGVANLRYKYDPWCKLDDESFRAKISEAFQILPEFTSRLPNDLARLPLTIDDVIYTRPMKHWLPIDLFPPAPPNMPPMELKVPPVIIKG